MNQRAAVVQEAIQWLGTPYHHQAKIKGVGVDCALLLCEVYHAAGLIPAIDPRPYPQNWHLHRDTERYLGWVDQYAKPTDIAKPGDLIVFKFGRAFSHAGIYVGNDDVIHSLRDAGVVKSPVTQQPLLGRESKIYTFWGEA
jgi:NlpC/P60 family putative phage cell wall peptidase